MLSPANQAQQTEQITMCVADASADPDLTFPVGETRLQAYYLYLGTTSGTMADYELISAPYSNHANSKPLVTPDTATEITLYPFGNFCNSYVANLEDTEFTFVLTNEDNPAGESATVLIKTDSGASDFPTLADAEYVEGAPFEADAYFDLYAWHNGATVAYTFLRRSEPPVSPYYFITTWKTDNAGTSNSTSITIPTFSGETYDYEVSWENNGVWEAFNTDTSPTHDYGVAGTYTVAIRGVFPRIYFNLGGDRLKLLSIEQWGNIVWTSMKYSFGYCSNLISNAVDAPNLTMVSNMEYAFYGCTALNMDMSDWDVSNVASMNNFMNGSSLSTINYDLLLIAWSALSLKNTVLFNVGTTKYTGGGAAAAARANIISNFGWTITDGGTA
jgi:surface protein